jgi:photosystem II stability/assembly factor-like uncharacterized protein
MKFYGVCVFICCVLISSLLFPVTSADERLLSYQKHVEMRDNSIFRNLKWKGIGPLFCGGRINDIEGYEKNSNKFYIASASGGLWVTADNGKSWQSIFDNESSITIGDIAISQTNEKLIWVGTGEANSSRSSFAGTGVFKSTDGGKSWKNKGLEESHHIGRIIINPKDNNIVYVAVLGHLYSDNEERGLYKTTDGGETWKKVLYISPRTGIIDLVMHPNNNKIIYATSWQKERKLWNFEEGGVESAIYKSTDAGNSWKKSVNGIPQDRYVGRIGLSISRSNPDVLYAFLDNQRLRPDRRAKKRELTIKKLFTLSKEEFLGLSNKRLNTFLKKNRAPKIYTADLIKRLVTAGKTSPQKLAGILLDIKEKLNPNIIGAEVYRSSDSGDSWIKMNKNYLSKMMLTFGFYFGQIRVSPENENTIYILGIPVLKSTNGGQTFKNISHNKELVKDGVSVVHVDSHAMWIDPYNPKRILLGTDGGLNVSEDGGNSWKHINNIPLAQCYTINYDLEEPYNIYTGLQDNGVVIGSSPFKTGSPNSWRTMLGGDGALVEVSKSGDSTAYAEAQFGALFRLNIKTQEKKDIKPESTDINSPYRFNWLSPILISNHAPNRIYMGTNKMLRSVDKGERWAEISPDLSNREHTHSNVPFATITSIDESPFTPNILYAGTDDGNVWVTTNAGHSWDKISSVLPNKWVSRIVASKYKKKRVYLTLNGFREDDFKTYIFMSEDFGLNWESLKNNLPDEPVNVIREDPQNQEILYIGTDLGVYISLDRGEYWYSLKNNLPTNAVHDLQVHPREQEIIIGTHGRGVFLLSAKSIQQLIPEISEEKVQ